MQINYSPYHQIITIFIGFLDLLGPKKSKNPIKKRNDLVVGTLGCTQLALKNTISE